LSAHADGDGLMRWIRSEPSLPRRTFVVHGEPDAADRLRLRLSDELHADARVPEHLERVTLE
jgi:metallo-beta-lactamase family protein